MTYGLPFPTPEYCDKCRAIVRVYPDIFGGQVVVKCAGLHHVVRRGPTVSKAAAELPDTGLTEDSESKPDVPA